MPGHLHDAVSFALKGMDLLDSAERDATALCVSVESLMRIRTTRLLPSDVPPLLLEAEHVLRAQRIAATHVEMALRFVHQILSIPNCEQLAAVQADALFALSIRSLASQRTTTDLIVAVVHVIRESFPIPPASPEFARSVN